MKDKFLTTAILAAAICAGCSSGANNGGDNSNSAPVNQTLAADQNSENSNHKPIGREWYNQMVAEKGKTNSPRKPIAANIAPIINPAPDNSEIQGEMNAKGNPVETRTFKNNPVLSKIVRTRTVADEAQATVKIYLKNGKVIDFPAGKLENVMTAPADDIIKAIGK